MDTFFTEVKFIKEIWRCVWKVLCRESTRSQTSTCCILISFKAYKIRQKAYTTHISSRSAYQSLLCKSVPATRCVFYAFLFLTPPLPDSISCCGWIPPGGKFSSTTIARDNPINSPLIYPFLVSRPCCSHFKDCFQHFKPFNTREVSPKVHLKVDVLLKPATFPPL